MHTSPPPHSQHQQPMPMDGVSKNGATNGQQAMEVSSVSPRDPASTTNGSGTTTPAQAQTKAGQNVFVHKLYKYGINRRVQDSLYCLLMLG